MDVRENGVLNIAGQGCPARTVLVGLHADAFRNLSPAVHFIGVHFCKFIRRIGDRVQPLADQQFLRIRRID